MSDNTNENKASSLPEGIQSIADDEALKEIDFGNFLEEIRGVENFKIWVLGVYYERSLRVLVLRRVNKNQKLRRGSESFADKKAAVNEGEQGSNQRNKNYEFQLFN